MVSYFKTSFVVSVLFVGVVCADAAQDAVAYEHGVQAGVAYIDGMVQLMQKNYVAGKELIDQSTQNGMAYYGQNHNAHYYRGAIAGLDKKDVVQVVNEAGLDDQSKAFVLVMYHQVRDGMIVEANKKSPQAQRQELLEKVALVVYKEATPAIVEQIQSSVEKMMTEITQAIEDAAKEGDSSLEQYA